MSTFVIYFTCWQVVIVAYYVTCIVVILITALRHSHSDSFDQHCGHTGQLSSELLLLRSAIMRLMNVAMHYFLICEVHNVMQCYCIV